MGTENALMAAALTPGPTTISNAACEPHVQDLARLLTRMGAEVDGIGSNVMTVHGRDRLGGAEHTISPDHIEVGSFMALAAATGGELRIRDVEPGRPASWSGASSAASASQSEIEGDDMIVPPGQQLRVRADIGDAIPKIEDGPWPAFPADLTSIALALATQADGEILIFEKMFENRLFFVDKLVAMGARITLCDPHRAIVSGPSRLHGERAREPRHPRRDGDAHRRPRRRRHLGDRQHPPDRPRLRADRRAPARPRRADRAGLCGGPCLAGLSRPLS